jgi:hypothetical protein
LPAFDISPAFDARLPIAQRLFRFVAVQAPARRKS